MNKNNKNGAPKKAPVANIKKMGEVILFDKEELKKLKLVYANSEDKEMLKAVREMRTRLYKNTGDTNFVCLVTSVVSQGGGSFVARNLAATITMDTNKTALLVDCNLYTPSAEVLLAVEPLVGLTDYLNEGQGVSVDDIIYASGVPRLRVVPVGNDRDGGTEKIMSPQMASFIEGVKSRYPDRVVVVDGPSVGEYDAEVRILVELCDVVILVVPDNMVTDMQIHEAIESIGKEKIHGVVINKAKP